MAKISASQAAKMVGKSTPTITRAIKSGKLTAEKREGGGYNIDPAELVRVWPAVTDESDVTPTKLGSETPNFTNALQVEVKMLREMLEKTEAERDDWKEQAAKAQEITALVTHQQDKPKETVRWVFWPWGRKTV